MRRKTLKKGEEFGRLTVIRQAEDRIRSNGYPRYYWKVRCECGTKKEIEEYKLTSGHTVSCGCIRFKNKPKIKDHMHFNRANNILRRCNSKKCPEYKWYGARGIKCLLGDTATSVVKQIDKVEGYFKGAHLDRIDNDGHYEIGNLRWVTVKVNQNNRRDNVNLKGLETKPRTRKVARAIIERLGYEFEDFEREYVKSDQHGKRRYLFILK